MDPFSLFVLFSHFGPLDGLMGVFLLFFHDLCLRLHVHKNTIERSYSLRVASHGLKWEYKPYEGLFKSSRTNRTNSAIEMDLNLVSETHCCNPKQLNHLFLL